MNDFITLSLQRKYIHVKNKHVKYSCNLIWMTYGTLNSYRFVEKRVQAALIILKLRIELNLSNLHFKIFIIVHIHKKIQSQISISKVLL